MNVRTRNWCFTSFTEPKPDTSGIQYLVYQKEIGEKTKREHYQGYVEFRDKQSIRTIKRIFGNESLHLEPRRGTLEQASSYCNKNDPLYVEKHKKKLEDAIGEPFIFGEPKKQGKRSDIGAILDDVNEGDTMEEILATHGGNALRIINCIEKAMKVRHRLYALDDYIRLQRKEKMDPLDEKIDDDLYKKLYG